VLSSGSDSFSRSALGHAAFVELLRAQGVPLIVSRHSSAERAGRRALLVLAEPQLDTPDTPRERRLEAMLSGARDVLLVLPKWRGSDHRERPGWVGAVRPVPGEAITRVLAAAGVSGSVAAAAGPPAGCTGTSARPTWGQRQLLTAAADGLRPLVSCAGGVLLGELPRTGGGRLLVLSDPDAFANHALGKGDHARLAMDLVALARRPGQPLVIDEVLHGHERVPSLWRELFAFPLLPSVLQAALALAAFVAAGVGRFGAALRPPPALASGRAVLIENTASLLRLAGHSAHTLGRYFESAVSDVARALHAPAAVLAGDVHGWLHSIGRRRGVGVDLPALERQVHAALRAEGPPAAILAAARRIHRWKEEMLRGPQHHPGR
jgi:hypothetical protein